jgi:DNA replication protein DnaC
MIPPEFRTEKKMTFDELAQKQCEWYNESEGRLTGIDCPDCKNRGNFQILDANGYRVMRECKCMAHRRYISMMQSAGLGDLYEKCTFDAYKVESDWQQTCKARSMAYAAKDGNAWYLFSGNTGSGKTHLCTAICSELAKRGRGIKYLQWKPLFDKLVRTKFKDFEQEQVLRECKNADVLYIDDFLKTPRNIAPSPEMVAYALEIVDARYIADNKTIFSTEFTLNEIMDFDEALGGRIREKTEGNMCIVKREEGRNYRRRNEKQ